MLTRRTVASLVILSGSRAATAQATIRWDLTNEYQPSSLIGQGNTFFADKVKELTAGRIAITNHFSGALGFKSKDVLDAVGRGAVPLGDASTIFWGGIDPLFGLSGLPFLTRDAAQSRQLFEIAQPFYEKALAKQNQYLLFVSPWPPSGIWSKRPLGGLDGLRGLKIRTYDPASTNAFRGLGAAPQQLAWADVIPLLATGGIEAVLTSADGGAAAKFWEHTQHFTEISYAMPLSMATINKDEFDKLSAADKKAVRDAASATQDRQWAGLKDRVAENYAEMRAKGMTIATDVPNEMKATFATAAEPIVKEWQDRLGTDGKAILDGYRAKIRG